MKAELIDVMGDDLRVANAARVSFDKKSEWECNVPVEWYGGSPNDKKWLSEKDQKLITYLASHNHWTPFSHVMITMRETVPISIARQRFKHTIGFTYNEHSGRYITEEKQFYMPEVLRNHKGKQGSEGVHPRSEMWLRNFAAIYETASGIYDDMVADGVAIEQARFILPQGMLTSYYVTGSLQAWSRAYHLRIAPDAQKEIQELAKQWNEIISKIPELKYSWQALSQQC